MKKLCGLSDFKAISGRLNPGVLDGSVFIYLTIVFGIMAKVLLLEDNTPAETVNKKKEFLLMFILHNVSALLQPLHRKYWET